MKVANVAASALLALLLSLTAAFGIAAAVDSNSPPSLMSRADYLDAMGGIRSDLRLALGRCRGQDPRSGAVCRAQARAGERIAIARLDARYLGTVAAQERVRAVQARAAQSIARSRRLAAT